jgi:hypothetical protein
MDSRADYESGGNDIGLATIAAADRQRDYTSHDNNNHLSSLSSSSSSSTSSSSSSTSSSLSSAHRDRVPVKSSTEHNPIVREIKKHRRKQKSTVQSQLVTDNELPLKQSPAIVSTADNQQTDRESEIPIKFRLSNGNEHRLYCKSNEKIRHIKRRLAMLENGKIDCQIQRLYFGGKLLSM